LQHGTQTAMTVMWKTNRPATTRVMYGETSECERKIVLPGNPEVHEVRLTDLQPETQYFYRTESQTDDESDPITSDVFTFQTAVKAETPFAFAVISDTQGNPEVAGKLATFAWEQRPNFLLHPGDLVSTGPNDSHWTEHFFPSMNPLIRRVPFFPVLGNHEQNAKNYFDYVSLPAPEFRYTFSYGNLQCFMIDSNRNIDPGSDQYRWLDAQLKKSEATWKLVCHHHPPYSSDENDYGNLWKTNKSTRGDLRARQLVSLYEKHDVDLVWTGHIHSYERTWPIRSGKAVDGSAPIYMVTGGGGGSLETPGPFRPFFQNTVRRGHHYSMVRVNGNTLEIQVYDLENRLFDSLNLRK
ncbi:MAG: metallophosphoesterase family protein, partial [Planctomycetota bacterium]